MRQHLQEVPAGQQLTHQYSGSAAFGDNLSGSCVWEQMPQGILVSGFRRKEMTVSDEVIGGIDAGRASIGGPLSLGQCSLHQHVLCRLGRKSVNSLGDSDVTVPYAGRGQRFVAYIFSRAVKSRLGKQFQGKIPTAAKKAAAAEAAIRTPPTPPLAKLSLHSPIRSPKRKPQAEAGIPAHAHGSPPKKPAREPLAVIPQVCCLQLGHNHYP